LNESTAHGNSIAATPEALQRAFARQHGRGAKVSNLERLSGGASSQSWRFELHDREKGTGLIRRCVLQIFAGGHQYPGALDKRTQALVQRAAFAAGVPTPEVILILEPQDALGEGFVSSWQDGEALGLRIVRDESLDAARRVLVEDCARALARIHAVPTELLPALPVRDAPCNLRDLEAAHRSYHAPIPVFELALRWLKSHRHASATATPRLVHGDFRNGNLLVRPTGLGAVLDWEMAHLGDPLEDLGWLMVNAWRFGRFELPAGGFGSRDQLLTAYERESGRSVDADSVRFWQMFGTLQWGVMCQWFVREYLTGGAREIERIAIGRRISEVELDLLDLLRCRD